jgi:hypothetical protein
LLRESDPRVAPRSLLTEAQEWLRTALVDGPRPAREILRDASEAGIGRDLLYAARKLEGVRIGKERVAGGRWLWSSAAIAVEHPGLPDPSEVQEVQEVQEVRPITLDP